MKHVVLVAFAAVVVGAVWMAPDLSQYERYVMADQRTIAGVPNAMDVVSNVLFLFVGVVLTTFGSGWFHLAPSPARMVWDRLPMTLAFTALLTAVIAERISVRAARLMFVPLVVAGLASVVYWRIAALHGAPDVRPYALVQFGSLAVVTSALALYRDWDGGAAWLWAGLALYAIAMIVQMADSQIYHALGVVSGHTLKHVLAAAGGGCIVAMLRRREATFDGVFVV